MNTKKPIRDNLGTIVIVCMLIADLVFLSLVACLMVNSNDSNGYTSDLINTVISCMSVVIATWVGLNVYNLIERRNLDKTESLLANVEKRIDLIQQKEDKIIKNKIDEDFDEVISLIKRDKVWGQIIIDKCISHIKEETDILSQILHIERVFHSIDERVDNHVKYKVVSDSNKCLNLVNGFESMLNEIEDKRNDDLLNLYIPLTRGYLHYFIGRAGSGLTSTEIVEHLQKSYEALENVKRIYDEIIGINFTRKQKASFFNQLGYILLLQSRAEGIDEEKENYLSRSEGFLHWALEQDSKHILAKRNLAYVIKNSDEKKGLDSALYIHKQLYDKKPSDFDAYYAYVCNYLEKIDKEIGFRIKGSECTLTENKMMDKEFVKASLEEVICLIRFGLQFFSGKHRLYNLLVWCNSLYIYMYADASVWIKFYREIMAIQAIMNTEFHELYKINSERLNLIISQCSLQVPVTLSNTIDMATIRS